MAAEEQAAQDVRPVRSQYGAEAVRHGFAQIRQGMTPSLRRLKQGQAAIVAVAF